MRRLCLVCVIVTVSSLCGAGTASAQSILVFDHNSETESAMNALTAMGLAYTQGTSESFTGLLTGSAWDLVIIDLPGTPPIGAWHDAVAAYIAGGGKVIATAWDDADADALAPSFEIAPVEIAHDAVALYRWDASHRSFTVPNVVPDITAGLTDEWGTNGFYLRPTGGGVALAGAGTLPVDGRALIVLGNAGRTFFDGFLFDDYGRADNDADGVIDAIELIQDQVSWLLDRDGDGYFPYDGDCNDADPTVHPGADDLWCDGVDANCDGSDEPVYDGDLGSALGTISTGNTCGQGNDFGRSRGMTVTCAGGQDSPDLAFLWTAPATGRFVFDTEGTAPEWDTALQIRSVGCPSSQLGCDDDSGTNYLSRVVRDFVAGEQVVIVVDGYPYSSTYCGAYVLNADWDCADADRDGYHVCGPDGVPGTGDAGEDCDDDDADIHPGAPELCNSVDDDCDAATGDGTEEAWYGAACDGGDADLCAEGAFVCLAGFQECDDATSDNIEVCNNVDDDCNLATLDGSQEPWYGVDCDGPDTDLCLEGASACIAGRRFCTDDTTGSLDLCGGGDEDCNPATPDGSDEAWYGDPCDGPDTDLCAEGAEGCVGGARVCSDTTGDNVEVCNGVDDDCNAATADGSAEPWLGAACDGTDVDLCAEGTYACTGGAQTCSDPNDADPDICNGVDDDCNAATADGSGDPMLGVACDGADVDLCAEGVFICAAASLACSDTTDDNVELCNGEDDDCDAETDDGSGEDWFDDPCDGADTDLCLEGFYGCVDGEQVCDDATGDVVELCNGLDDDCDGETPTNEADVDLDTYRLCDGDCNDADAAYHPGAPETDCADPNDYNCDGSTGYTDADGDGFAACEECNDADPTINPDAEEVCDGVDDDCDGELLEGEQDDDDDGFPACAECDDADPLINPDADEICNGVDDDCDEVLLEGEEDLDDDGFLGCADDCDDTAATINPDAEEVCDEADNDCDGQIDEGDVCTGPDGDADVDADADGDGDADGGADGGPDADGDADGGDVVETTGCNCTATGDGRANGVPVAIVLLGALGAMALRRDR